MVVYIENEKIRYRASDDTEVTRKAREPSMNLFLRGPSFLEFLPFDEGPFVSDRNKTESEG